MQSFKFHFICPFHDFSAQLPYSSPSPPTPPLSLLCYSHSLSPNYRTKQNYFDLYARRAAKAKATVPWRSSSSTCPSRVSLLFFSSVCFFRLSIDLGLGRWVRREWGGRVDRPTKCFDSAWTRLQLLSTKRADDDERRI